MAKPRARAAVAPAPDKAKEPSREWARHAAILAVLAIAVYANCIGNGFVSDDNWQLVKNPAVVNADLAKLFGGGVWSFGPFAGARSNYYRPLPFAAYALLCNTVGLHAPAFHLFMVLLHAINCVLLYFLVQYFAPRLLAFAAAVLFAIHPIHTEAVDWIAALPDAMLTTLVLAAVLQLARQGASPKGRQIAVHCGLYLSAMLSKEPGVMLLPLYAGFGFFCAGRRWSEFRHNLRLYACLAVTLGIYLAMRWSALGGFVPGREAYFHLTPIEFVLSTVVTAGKDVAGLLLPVNLNFFQVFQPTRNVTLPLLASIAALGAIGFVFLRVRNPLISYGILWAAVTIAPTLDLVSVGESVVAERYLYLPSAAFCWIAAWAWTWCYERKPAWAKVAAGAVLLACSVEVMARNRDWRDDYSLFAKTAQQSPTSPFVNDTLASVYVERNAFDLALEHERLAVQYRPDRAVYRKKLGYLLLEKDPRGAVREFRKVLELEPTAGSVGHCDLALALDAAGESAQAAEEYSRALQLDPQNSEASVGLRRVMNKLSPALGGSLR
jgi:tetratricopeptide (TPR) repeat protein